MNGSWPQLPLGELLAEQKVRVGVFDADGLPLLGVSNTLGLHRTEKPRIADMSRYLRVDHGWFAYNPMRINVGSIGWAERPEQTGVISPDYVVFSCTDRIEPRLLYLFLRSAVGLRAINLETAGSVRERLYFDSLARIRFPVPPVPEQQEIAARIEELAAKINEARELRQKGLEEAEALIKSVRRSLFGETPHADWIPLSRYVTEIENGKSPQCESRPATDEEWGVLKVGAVSFGSFDQRENKALPVGIQFDPRHEVRTGDFLMSRANTTELVGVCAIVGQTRRRLLLSDKTFRFRIRRDVELALQWLDHALKSPALRDQIQRGASGTSPTMKNISKEKVMTLKLPPHTLSQQHRVLAQLETLQLKVASLKRLQTETAAELDTLLLSILNKVFRREL